jgi:hypothetical protein
MPHWQTWRKGLQYIWQQREDTPGCYSEIIFIIFLDQDNQKGLKWETQTPFKHIFILYFTVAKSTYAFTNNKIIGKLFRKKTG